MRERSIHQSAAGHALWRPERVHAMSQTFVAASQVEILVPVAPVTPIRVRAPQRRTVCAELRSSPLSARRPALSLSGTSSTASLARCPTPPNSTASLARCPSPALQTGRRSTASLSWASSAASLAQFSPRAETKFGLKYYLEVDGLQPVVVLGADWNPKPVAGDPSSPNLCPRAPVVFDRANTDGAAAWGPRARGAIVVAVKGRASVETAALRAEVAGAVALVFLDDGAALPSQAGGAVAPSTPTVIAPKSLREALCEGEGVSAAVVCRRCMWAAPRPSR